MGRYVARLLCGPQGQQGDERWCAGRALAASARWRAGVSASTSIGQCVATSVGWCGWSAREGSGAAGGDSRLEC
uniref:Uncharacterized protein OSJNBa0061K21.3 n=1 Tax=Oryza sativa TaxID=4530 RepID=Q8S873_ORYSA|nr:Hypothetical protein [Oryza sativa]